MDHDAVIKAWASHDSTHTFQRQVSRDKAMELEDPIAMGGEAKGMLAGLLPRQVAADATTHVLVNGRYWNEGVAERPKITVLLPES